MKIIYKEFDPKYLSLVKEKEFTYKILYNKKPLELRCPKLISYENVKDELIYLNITHAKSIVNILFDIDRFVLKTIYEKQLLGEDKKFVHLEDIYKNNASVITDNKIIWKCKLDPKIKLYDKDAYKIESLKIDEVIEDDDILIPLIELMCVRITRGTIKCFWEIKELRFTKKITDCQISDVSDDDDDEPEGRQRHDDGRYEGKIDSDSE